MHMGACRQLIWFNSIRFGGWAGGGWLESAGWVSAARARFCIAVAPPRLSAYAIVRAFTILTIQHNAHSIAALVCALRSVRACAHRDDLIGRSFFFVVACRLFSLLCVRLHR